MDISLLTSEGFLFLLRWLHFIFGVIWIGHLYYFNFTQGGFFAETDAATKSNCIQKLVPRALWWFRWGAMFTMATGVLILLMKGHQNPTLFVTAWGVSILTGAALGLLMWYNVWFVIWPNQKVVIENALQTASGKPANPQAASCAAKAGLCSRSNVLFSFPMLFFMGAASHLPLTVTTTNFLPLLLVIGGVLVVLELNGLKGKMGPMTTVKGVIHCGVGLTLVLYVIMEVLTK